MRQPAARLAVACATWIIPTTWEMLVRQPKHPRSSISTIDFHHLHQAGTNLGTSCRGTSQRGVPAAPCGGASLTCSRAALYCSTWASSCAKSRPSCGSTLSCTSSDSAQPRAVAAGRPAGQARGAGQGPRGAPGKCRSSWCHGGHHGHAWGSYSRELTQAARQWCHRHHLVGRPAQAKAKQAVGNKPHCAAVSHAADPTAWCNGSHLSAGTSLLGRSQAARWGRSTMARRSAPSGGRCCSAAAVQLVPSSSPWLRTRPAGCHSSLHAHTKEEEETTRAPLGGTGGSAEPYYNTTPTAPPKACSVKIAASRGLPQSTRAAPASHWS